VKTHVFRVKCVFVTGLGVFPSCSGWLSCNHLFHSTYTYTYTRIINQSSTMATQQQTSLKSMTTDEVAKVSLFHARPSPQSDR
jgi:cytochrome b involved in lipid metabolism